MTREIKFYSTLGGGIQTITSSARTWGELKAALPTTISIEGMSATESINKRDLVLDSAELPMVPFIIFLRQSKTNQGVDINNLTHKGLMAYIKNKPELKARIKELTGKNYNSCPTELLKDTLLSIERENVIQEEVAYISNTIFSTDVIVKEDEILEILIRNLKNLTTELETLRGTIESIDDEDVLDQATKLLN